MTVGILLITHADLGRCLLQAARSILAAEPALAEAIDVPVDIEPDKAFDQALAACRRLDRGDGVGQARARRDGGHARRAGQTRRGISGEHRRGFVPGIHDADALSPRPGEDR